MPIRFTRLMVILTLFGLAGCDSSSGSSGGRGSMEQIAARLDAQKDAQPAEQAAQEGEQNATATEQPAPEQNRRRAGREAVAPGGYANAIIGARRHILNQTESWAWQQQVSHFQAEHGRLPKDHAEFMKEIVQEKGINLGFKEDNQEFLYDPNDKTQGPYGTLYVVEKAEAPVEGQP